MITQNNTPPIRVLIAEDQETDAFFVEQAFGQAKIENEIIWIKDGQEVLDYLNKEGEHANAEGPPDLIFLDINMPRKDGLETLQAIKTNDQFKHIPVIIMSGSQAMDDVIKAYGYHANAYVSKSNGFDDMLQFVDAIEKFWFLKARLPQIRDH